MSAPAYLSDLAKQIYEQTAESFPDLESGDPDLLINYSRATALVREMEQRIASEGLVVPNSRGNPSQHPLLNIQKGYMRTASDLSAQIRKRFQVKQDSADPFA